MENPIDQRGNSKNEAYERARSADVEERTIGADRRANEDESAEGADQRRKGNEERITRANVMMAASEEVTQFMSEQNEEQREGERKTCGEGEGVLVNQGERTDELVEGNGLILRISNGELSAGDQASAKSEKEQNACEEERLCRRPLGNRSVLDFADRESAPVDVDGDGWRRVLWERRGHERFGTGKVTDTYQYSTDAGVHASVDRWRSLLRRMGAFPQSD